MMNFTRDSFTYELFPHPDLGDQILSDGKRGYEIQVYLAGKLCKSTRFFSLPDGHLQGRIEMFLDNEAARMNGLARDGMFD